MLAQTHQLAAKPEATAAGLIACTALALLVSAAALGGVLVLVNRGDWWRGLLAASVVSTLSAAASLPPLLLSLRKGMQQRVAGYFAAAGIRALVSLGGCMLAVKLGHYPAAPTLLLMVVFYFAVLAVETIAIARALWDMKG
jgi:hypothetical protein